MIVCRLDDIITLVSLSSLRSFVNILFLLYEGSGPGLSIRSRQERLSSGDDVCTRRSRSQSVSSWAPIRERNLNNFDLHDLVVTYRT